MASIFSLLAVDVHAGGAILPIAGDGAEIFPAVPLIKPGVVRQQVQGGHAQGGHVPADPGQQLSGNAPAAVGRLHIHSADVGSQVAAGEF